MNRSFLFFIAVAMVISFSWLGRTTLFDVDEAVFSQATKEMVASGDWITPTYNGENRYDKPILFYWLMALSYKVFGIDEFGARFPSAAAGVVLALSVFLFTRYFRDAKAALYASLSTVLSIYFLAYSHAAVTDMVLTLFITLSLFSFYLSTAAQEASPNWRRVGLYGFYLFSSLAFLTKGLIGIVFPFGIAAAYMIATEGPRGLKRVFSLGGTVLFLAVSAPWYVMEYRANGMEFIDQFFIKHHFQRYTGVISGHRGPVYYYIPVLLVAMFPWAAFLPAGVRAALKDRDTDKLGVFALIWFSFILLFFSFSTTKLPNYTLPLMPAASLLIASGMTAQGERLRRYSYVFMAALSALMGALFLVSRGYLPKFGIEDVNWTLALSALMWALAALGVYAALRKKATYGIMSALTIAFLLVLSAKAVPIANQYLQGALYDYSLYAKENLPEGERIVTYRLNMPSIVFYSGHRVVSPGNKAHLLRLLSGGGRALAITRDRDVPAFDGLGFDLLESRGGYALLERR
ncbi:MAG: glycosyltransferase family 39 protein [Nitrospirota bacterium]